MFRHGLVAGFIVLTLSGCGGGGGSGTTSTPPPAVVPPPANSTLPDATPIKSGDGYSLFASVSGLQNEAVSLSVTAAANERIETIQWVQTAGPEITLIDAHTQVISFDAAEGGDYTFQLTGRTASGKQISDELEFSISSSDLSSAVIRLDHAASETAKVSLRADSSNARAVSSVSWEQIHGPTADNITTDDNYLFFDAPSVGKDSVLTFRASVTFSDGSTATDEANVIVKDVDINVDGYFPRFSEQVVSTDVKAFRPESPYATAMERCVYNNTIDQSCRFSELPLIGQEHISPSVTDILNRTLVSHPWMGERFKDYLEQSVAAPDMLKLLRGVTAIVISYDVRPSFYWAATGAIYLDARNFWVTPQERDTLNDQPDFRSNFGDDLNFIIPWRYIKDNRYYLNSSGYPVEQRLTKSFTDSEASITWLMYHELGHANDFFPPRIWANIDRSTSPLNYIDQNDPDSSAFTDAYPLNSDELKGLAQVSFFGETASGVQRGYDAQDVVSFFEPDASPAYYSYSTIREDYATLFERFMMAYRMGVSADVGIVNTDGSGFPVSWGQRDRISHPDIQPRVKAVVGNILPELDTDSIYSTLPAPTLLTQGVDWRSNRVNSTAKGQSREKRDSQNPVNWRIHKHWPTMPDK